MLNLENLAENIAASIAESLQMDSEKKAVIAYGIFCFLDIFISVMIVILLGFVFHVLAEALIISFSISILRKYSGGVHASTLGKCMIIGTVITIIPAIMIHYLSLNSLIVLLGYLLVFVWAFYEIYTKAPVDSIKKPINNIKKRKRLKKSSLVVLGLYSVITVLLLIVYYSGDYRNFIRYAASVIYGTAWQVFTLTKAGNRLFIYIDAHLLKKIN